MKSRIGPFSLQAQEMDNPRHGECATVCGISGHSVFYELFRLDGTHRTPTGEGTHVV